MVARTDCIKRVASPDRINWALACSQVLPALFSIKNQIAGLKLAIFAKIKLENIINRCWGSNYFIDTIM